jgi:hypothetical protein
MPFASFKTLQDAAKTYGVTVLVKSFLSYEPRTPNSHLEQELKFNLEHIPVRVSEPAINAFLIVPVLREVWKSFTEVLSLWSHTPFEGEELLQGVPDYCFTRPSPLGMVQEKPYALIIETTKKEDFDIAWAHCLVAMLAAQKLNEPANLPVLGGVSNGTNWNLGKLEGHTFTQEMRHYSIMELRDLLGALHALFEMAKQNAWSG